MSGHDCIKIKVESSAKIEHCDGEVEGDDVGEWVLVDSGDVIAHVMQPITRDYYQLEKLWGEDSAHRAES